MSNQEAQFILNAYRPGGADANDPAMKAALDQAARDPVLGAWFARQQAHGAAVAEKLREIAPPPGLREAILAGGRASRRPEPRSVWRRWPAWWAAAAMVTFLLGMGAWWRLSPAHGTSFAEFAVEVVDHGFRLQKRGSDLAELRTWLAEHRGPLPDALPTEFAQLRALGCRTLDFRGQNVSLICFERDGGAFHVFVARRENVPGEHDGAKPRFMARGSLVAAAWSDARHFYVVVSDANLATLRQVL